MRKGTPARIEGFQVHVTHAGEQSKLQMFDTIDEPEIELALTTPVVPGIAAVDLHGAPSAERRKELTAPIEGQVAVLICTHADA